MMASAVVDDACLTGGTVVMVAADTLWGPGCRFLRCYGYWRVFFHEHLGALGGPAGGLSGPAVTPQAQDPLLLCSAEARSNVAAQAAARCLELRS